ncbi:DNA recombination/repair protein RecA, partial [Staphylococcus aureus]
GRALKFYSSVRLEVRRAEQLKQGQDIVGNRTKIKVVKNKVAPPFRVAEVDIMYGQGISKEGELIDLGVENDIVDKSGACYSYNGDRMGQGKETDKNYLKENPQIKEEIDRKLREKLGIFDGDVDENENEDDSPKTLFDE